MATELLLLAVCRTSEGLPEPFEGDTFSGFGHVSTDVPIDYLGQGQELGYPLRHHLLPFGLASLIIEAVFV